MQQPSNHVLWLSLFALSFTGLIMNIREQSVWSPIDDHWSFIWIVTWTIQWLYIYNTYTNVFVTTMVNRISIIEEYSATNIIILMKKKMRRNEMKKKKKSNDQLIPIKKISNCLCVSSTKSLIFIEHLISVICPIDWVWKGAYNNTSVRIEIASRLMKRSINCLSHFKIHGAHTHTLSRYVQWKKSAAAEPLWCVSTAISTRTEMLHIRKFCGVCK